MDFQDNPIQPRVIPWKLILIIGAGVVIGGGIIWGIWAFTHRNSVGNGSSVGVPLVGTRSTDVPTSVDRCIDTANPEGCKTYLAKKDAAAKKDIKGCDSLTLASKDDCVWGVAVAANDASLCSTLSQKSDATLCADRIQTSTAVSASDDAMCDKIADDAGKTNCHVAVLATVTVTNCAERKQDPAYCVYLKIVDSAVKASDRDLCNALTDATRLTSCRTRVIFDDPDHDELSTSQEMNVYHTDPRNQDTDGDGYSDGAEVKSGHDALKK